MEWRTVEVRWFYPGPCPPEVADWFHGGKPGEPEARTDEYARLDRDDLGIKRRGGTQLDVKVRTARPDLVSLPAGLDGRVEGWAKWSFPLDPSRPSELSWLPVEKLRWTRRYRVGSVIAEPIPPDELVPAGCAAELAVIRIGSVDAWTFGFEAFDVAGDAVDSLTAGAEAFVSDSPPGSIAFEFEDSCGYPAWLRRLE